MRPWEFDGFEEDRFPMSGLNVKVIIEAADEKLDVEDDGAKELEFDDELLDAELKSMEKELESLNDADFMFDSDSINVIEEPV